jgi:GAF domain-containing protein
VLNDRFIGTLAVYHSRRDFYTDDHRRLLDRVSEQASAVIHNSIVFEQTQEDSLTDPYEALLATADSRMYRDKTRRKQQPRLSVATGTEGRAAGVAQQEPSEIDIQRATIGLF